MKISKTAIGVVVFVIILVLAGYSAKSNAEQYAYIGVGKTVINSHLTVGMIGYEYNNWEANARLLEDGQTINGHQDQMQIYSLSHLTKPNWGYKGVDPYFRIGASYNNGSALVGRTNFMLGVGLNFHKVFRVEFVHDSSANIHNPNTGVDQIVLSYIMDVPWN